jgi:hypothetical protein
MTSRAQILAEYGITDGSNIRVQAIPEREKLWNVGINAVGNAITAISPMRAQELAARLSQIGETALASEISTAAHSAHKANGNV